MKQDPILKENALLRDSEASRPWIKAGFRIGDKGTHTSRTIMFKELDLLFEDLEPVSYTHLTLPTILLV